MRNLFRVALLVAILASPVLAVPDPWWTRETASLKDWQLVEKLKDPTSEGRYWAAFLLSQRWKQKDYLKLLREDWDAGSEALGFWPDESDELLAYLLSAVPSDGAKFKDAATLASANVPIDKLEGAPESPCRTEALKLWATEWVKRVPPGLVWTDELYFMANSKRGWLRDVFYGDASEWASAWGSVWGANDIPWRLVEYRQVLALLSGEEHRLDKPHLERNEFLRAVRDAITTGNNTADVPMSRGIDDTPGVYDRLSSGTHYRVKGCSEQTIHMTYAELVCIVMDRPDWVRPVQERLRTAKVREAILDFGWGGIKVVETTKDLSSPLIGCMAKAGLRQVDQCLDDLARYYRREWPGFQTSMFSDNILLEHPWFNRVNKNPVFQERFSAMSKPLPWPK